MDRDRLGIAFQLISITDQLERRLAQTPRSISTRAGEVVSDHMEDLRALADRVVENVTSGRDAYE
jgi:hypothetical protein